jgi:hypothetical protein
MQKYIFNALFLFILLGCGKSSPTAVTPPAPPVSSTPPPAPAPTTPHPPTITDAWPNNNPAGWPVMIKGTNLQNISKIMFGNQVAVIDTLLDSIATTHVPAAATAGNANLTVENKDGTSNTFSFTVLGKAPQGVGFATKIVIGRKPRYLPSLPDGNQSSVGWKNPFVPGYFISFSFSGNFERWNSSTDDFPFDILQYPIDSARTIQINIHRTDSTTEKYTGNFIAMDDSTSTSQRILFYNPDKRQIVVVSN